MLKVTTKSGRVYLIDGNRFMRCGEGSAPGQWYCNNTWTRLSFIEGDIRPGESIVFWQRGSWTADDLWSRTSPIETVEEVSE